MKQLFAMLLSMTVSCAMAQTKKIAYKSHSGSTENFSSALKNELFDMENSNFGVAPTRLVRHAELDSVIFICDTLALMVTSEYCTHTGFGDNLPEGPPRLWKPGKVAVKNHPLFSHQHSLDSIKQVIRTLYNFRNPVEKVVFIGYDNEKGKPLTKKRKPDQAQGAAGFTGYRTPLDNTGAGILISILAISVFCGWAVWLFYKKETKIAAGMLIVNT